MLSYPVRSSRLPKLNDRDFRRNVQQLDNNISKASVHVLFGIFGLDVPDNATSFAA
jgi:hypothetical protein